MRRAFFSSSRFLTTQFCARHATGLANALSAIVTSDGTRSGDARIGAAEEDVLSRRFEIVIGDRVRAGPVPRHDRLRVLADRLDVRDIASR